LFTGLLDGKIPVIPFFMKRIYIIVCLAPLMSGLLHSCNNLPTDTFIGLDTVKVCTPEDEQLFNFISDTELGLTVRNYDHENIYRYSAKTAPWKPINGYREVLCGQFSQYHVDSTHNTDSGHDHQCESDWNIDIVPSAVFASSMGADQVEGEVTPPLSLRSISFFPTEGNERGCPLTGKPIAIYGPWVTDDGHDGQREIHPAEAIWWQNSSAGNADIELILLQDAACNRFDDRSFYNFDEDGDGQPDWEPNWVPWEVYPQVEEVKIPFQYNANNGNYTVMHIEEVEAENITTVLNPKLLDSDDGNDHKLKVKERNPASMFSEPTTTTLVEVQEQPSASPNYAIQFIDLCKSADGTIRGYVQVLVSLGNVNASDKHGYTVLHITQSVASNVVVKKQLNP